MDEQKKTLDWQVPAFTAPGKERYEWVEQAAIKEGEGFLEGQSAYTNLAKNLRIFDGILDDNVKSTLISNGLKYDIRKFIETISEVREIGTFGSDAPQFKPYASMLTKVAKCIYMESGFPGVVRKALQYSTVMGRGYVWPKARADNYGFGERRIVFEALGLLDVVPVQMPDTHDVQDAYAVTIYKYMPIAEAHGRFPLYQDKLFPVCQMDYQSRIQARRADFAERYHGGGAQRNWGNLNCEIRYTFVRDIAVNKTNSPMPMGDWSTDPVSKKAVPVTTWSYEVPYIGQKIFGGIQNGAPIEREATIEDCRIYPFLRLIITSPSMEEPLYDGPAFDWHGQIPVVQYDVDDWAWEAMGRSLVQDVGSIEVTKRKLERKMDRVITTTLNPPMGYDRTSTGGPKIENFDIFEEDVRIGLDGKPKEQLQSVLPEEVQVNGEHFKFLEMLAAMRKEQLGINDLGNLAAMKLNLTGEQIDKALEPIGPIAKGIAARMEEANAKVAQMAKTMIPQWLTTARIIEYIGPDSITPDVFDFDPNTLVPSHLPDEYQGGQKPATPSAYQRIDRQKYLAKNLRLISIPSTLLKITAMQEQMKWMNLKFKGAPIAWCDVLEKLGFENYGTIKGNTGRERWMNEQIEELKFKVEEMKLMAALGLDPSGGGPGQGKGGGRPGSGKKPPKQSQKGGAGGEPRIVNKES